MMTSPQEEYATVESQKGDHNNNNDDDNINKKTPFIVTKDNMTPIYFDENWDVGIGGGLWSTGLCLSKYFLDHPKLLKQNLKNLLSKTSFSGIRAIELGSGNGLLSCCLAAVIGDVLDTLYVTDLADHLDLMKQTVLANPHILRLENDCNNGIKNELSVKNHNNNNTTCCEPVKCHVMKHAWGEFELSGPLSKKFDFIFGSDVAYRDYLHEPLISSLLHFSHEHTISLVGVTMTDTKPIFFKSLREAGFRYDRIADHLMSEEFRGTTFGLFVITKKT